MPYTKEEVEKLARKIHNNEYSYLMEERLYTSHGQIKVICCKHGEYETMLRLHLSGRKCRKCYHSSKKGKLLKTKEYYVEIAKQLHNDFYIYDKYEYKGAYTKSIIVCPIHGDFVQSMNIHTKKNNPCGCSKCAIEQQVKRQRKTHEQYIDEVKTAHGDKYIIDNIIYTTAFDKIKPICRKHGEWETEAKSFVNGVGCPVCNESKGEKLVAKILDECGILYDRQKRYKDCKGKRNSLPFDFYIPSINTLVEFDGEQHFRPYRMFSEEVGKQKLLETQTRDIIKTNYCLSKGIPIIRVSYTMSEIEIRNLIARLVVI